MKSRFCSIHFTVILARLKQIVCHTELGLGYIELCYFKVPLYCILPNLMLSVSGGGVREAAKPAWN